MIFIKPDTTNHFILRLSEKRVVSTSYFLFELTNVFNQEVVYFSLDDLSTYQCDYNLFNLVESSTGSKVGGINIPLALIGGQYEYKVYETLTQTLDVNLAIGTYIEKDMLIVEIDKTVNELAEINNIYS
jgi:hypothetical protein